MVHTLTAVEPGALGVPRAEDGLDGEVHLPARVLREGLARLLLDDLLELLDQVLEVRGGHVEVALVALVRLELVEDVGEPVAVDVLDRLAEHLDEAAVGIPGEAIVAGLGRQAFDGLVVEPDVQDGLHHAGHGELRAGAHGDEQGVGGVAESPAHRLLDLAQMRSDLDVEGFGRFAGGEVGAAGLGGDGEAWGNRQAERGHLGEIRALSTEQILHVAIAFSE